MQFRSGAITANLEKAINNNIKKIGKTMLKKMEPGIKDSFRYAVNSIYPIEVAKAAPSPVEERKALVTGVDDKSRTVGSSVGGRFIKGPEFKYLQQAILDDLKLSVRSRAVATGVMFEFYIPKTLIDKINDEIGFAWMKRVGDKKSKSLTRRSTMDPEAGNAWRHLLNIWEDGGAIGENFKVKARDGGMLAPGPDKRIRSREVTKTIKPRHMFRIGKQRATRKIRNLVNKNILKRYGK